MHRTRIKICGVRRPEDAAAAARLGADAIGVVCYPRAGRYVPPETAAEVARAVRPFVSVVALFVDQSPPEVNDVAARVGATVVQLHGVETAEQVAAVRFPVIKAVRADRQTLERELSTWRDAVRSGAVRNLVGLVLETAGPGVGVGGTGHANDWAFLRDVRARGGFDGLPPIIAAGGLTPETVGDVVRNLQPYAVDVSSGVERVRGEKAHDLIAAFASAVDAADRAIAQ
ncbi:MAG TPA: phosphoribosylanthranilate isomerase [Humisphaera sp.]